MWLLLQWLRKAMTIATSTTLLLWFGFTGLTFTGWITFQQIDFPNPFLAPLYVAGLSWSVGLWQLTKAIDVYSQPKPLVDMAKSVDRA